MQTHWRVYAAAIYHDKQRFETHLVGLISLVKANSARGGVCVRHCRTEFIKQVFPRLA